MWQMQKCIHLARVQRKKKTFPAVNLQKQKKVLPCNPDITRAQYLVDGFSNGFSIGYEGL